MSDSTKNLANRFMFSAAIAEARGGTFKFREQIEKMRAANPVDQYGRGIFQFSKTPRRATEKP